MKRVRVAFLSIVVLTAACSGGTADFGPKCAVDQTACGQQCVSLATDPLNCGGCGIPCGTSEQTCRQGACTCPTGVLCNGACVPTDANPCAAAAVTLVTSAPGAYWKTDGLLTEVTAAGAKVDVTVDDSAGAQKQIWEGFGGAFNEKGWEVLSMLNEAERDVAVRLLYGADGARFTFGRIPIGASDYALVRYTLDETPDDTTLADFSIERDKMWLLPFIKAAQTVKPSIRFWASPWTPPTWMKAGPFQPGKAVSPFDGGTMKSDDATLQAFAAYLIQFVEAYAEQGIGVEAISPQNEPNYTGNYPTCGWSPATYAKFVGQHLGPAVAAAALPTKLVLGTFNGGGSDPAIVNSVLADDDARGYVDVLGYQWGMLNKVATARPYHVPVWQTEHKAGNYPWVMPFNDMQAPNDDAFAVESWGLIRDWIRAGVTAYSAWNMVLDTAGIGIDTTRVWPQNALLTVDTTARTLNITPTYYVFRHLSQFVAPGARVLATKGGDALAFKNPDGTIVTVVYNSGAARRLVVSAAGKRQQFDAPASGWATVMTN